MTQSLIGVQIDQYRVLEHVARGGMADVYLAEDVVLDRQVALKVMRPELAHDETFLTRFEREARAVAKLNHPHIIQIYAAGRLADERPYLAMQYVRGGTLKGLLKRLQERGQRYPAADALRLAQRVAEALHVAHQAGIVHRDIKPSNILLHPDGTPVLTDLGIAAISESTQITQADVTMGTPHYMSPEQASGATVDGRSDLYGLGVILYEMLSGRVPFVGDSPLVVLHQHVHQPPPPLEQVQPGLSPAIYALVAQALAKEPQQRFASARQMAEALEAARSAQATVLPRPNIPNDDPDPLPTTAVPILTTSQPAMPPQQTAPDAPRPRWLLIGSVLLGLLLCISGAVLGWRLLSSVLESPVVAPLPVPTAPVEGQPTAAPGAAPATPQVDANVTAVRAAAPPTIDGNLNDWPETMRVEAAFRVYENEAWDGSEDVTAVWQLAWDNTNLYLGVTVTDDALVQTQTGNQLFRGDSVSLQIDTDSADDGETLVSPDDFQLDFSPGDFSTLPPATFRFRGTADNRMLDALGYAITVRAQQTADGYVIEAAVPWLDLETQPQPGQQLGAALNVTDNDTPETAVQEAFYSHVATRRFSDPTSWGTLTLLP